MPWGAVAGAAVGVVGNALLGGGSSGSTTSSSSNAPWDGVQPYLLGTTKTNADGTTTTTPGLYEDAQKLYQGGQWSPGMQSLADKQYSALGQRSPYQTQLAQQLGNDLYGGKYDPTYNKIDPITQTSQAPMNWAQAADPYTAATTSASTIAGPSQINAQSVDPSQAFGSLGFANPSNSLSSLMSGQVNTSTLDPVVNNAMRRLSDNFNEQVMPALGDQAFASGQYGGSRQGIAQGLAAKGLALAQGDTAANLYNQAYQQAQQNMYGTANSMASLGLSNAQSNANRDLSAQAQNAGNQLATQQFNAGQVNSMGQFNANAQNAASQFNNSQNNALSQFNAGQGNSMGQFNAGQNNNMQQFNANLGLQDNNQAINYANALANNRTQGLNAMQTSNGINDNTYQQQLGLLQAPNSYNWQNMGQYNSLLTGGAQLGGTQTKTNPYYTNPMGNALGFASAGMGIYEQGVNKGLWGGNATSGNAASSTGNMSGFQTDPWGASSGALGSGNYGIWG